MWDLPGPGLKPMSPALVGGFLTTVPPGKPTTFIQHSLASASHSNQTRKRNKRNTNWKERSKTVAVSDDMILYIKKPKDATNKLLELINESGKVSGYKINI